MPYRDIEFLYDTNGDEIGVRIYNIGRNDVLEVLYADIPGNSWNQNRLDQFKQRAQDQIDERFRRSDWAALYPDDPVILSDPALPNLFWDGQDFVSRSALIETVVWDDVAQHLRITISDPRTT